MTVDRASLVVIAGAVAALPRTDNDHLPGGTPSMLDLTATTGPAVAACAPAKWAVTGTTR